MQTFRITVEETIRRVVEIEAADEAEALRGYEAGDGLYLADHDDCQAVRRLSDPQPAADSR